MKYVLLLGDSIRQNYQDYVKRKMIGIADVRFPNDNGRFGYYTLRYVREWISALSREDGVEFDVIHFNVGLWDILRLAGENNTFTSKEQYADLLLRIYRRIRKYCPHTKIVFALTTKIIEPGFAPGIEIGERKNSDIKLFNQVAVDTFKGTDVTINDLWSISEEINETGHSDNVHFDSDIGVKKLGDAVVNCIENILF